MYIEIKKAEELLLNMSNNILSELNIKTDFLLSLLEGNDWSLVIKSHTLIESIITELIITKSNEINLKSIIERLPLHDDKASKIKLIKAYNLVPEPQLRFIKVLSEIRNNIVHKFENIEFDFHTYVNNLDKNQKKNWQNTLLNSLEFSEKYKNEMNEVCFTNPRIAVWGSLLMFVLYGTIKINEIKGLKEVDSEAIKLASEILKEIYNN